MCGVAFEVNSVSITPDDENCIVISDSDTISIWNIASGKMIHILEPEAGRLITGIIQLSLSSDGLKVAVCYETFARDIKGNWIIKTCFLDIPSGHLSWDPYIKYVDEWEYLILYEDPKCPRNQYVPFGGWPKGEFKYRLIPDLEKSIYISYDGEAIIWNRSEQEPQNTFFILGDLSLQNCSFKGISADEKTKKIIYQQGGITY